MTKNSIEEVVRKLRPNQQKLISLLSKKKKGVITTGEITKKIGVKGRGLGGLLGGFSQSSMKLVIRISQDQWILNEKYEKELKEAIAKIEKYIW